jgi:hypothetical protein
MGDGSYMSQVKRSEREADRSAVTSMEVLESGATFPHSSLQYRPVPRTRLSTSFQSVPRSTVTPL